MLYANYSNGAIAEMEKQRTGDYGEDFESMVSNKRICYYCGENGDKLYIVEKTIMCEECICRELREKIEKFSAGAGVSRINIKEILKNIISDFSDNKMMCYVEELYEKC